MENKNNSIVPQESDFLLYTTPEGDVRVDVLFSNETVWLTQKRMAELFGVDVRTISEHIQNIFKTGELLENSVVRKFRNTATDGKAYDTQFYNLDVIISVGYRVNSEKATKFRVWATQTLRGYIVKGYAIDDERLKHGYHFGKDYFDELLEKIREIRASERRFYQKVTDLYAEGSVDYDKNSKTTLKFFKTVQNKLHWAITGQTAAELITGRVSSKKAKMGLTTWKNAPKGKILKPDVSVAKNYLEEKEISELNRIVTMYLDYAENQAKKQRPMKMEDWVEKLDAFLRFNEYEILGNPGKVSHEVAKALAEKEFDKYRVVQDREFISDFDRDTQKYLDKPEGEKPKRKDKK
ncbi:cell filamentation protein Fic [Candidatus Jorgensenbacteria bacterium RIFCSPHIGHO2_02_FULL_45_20]|uniref:Cell filamentation protein Fic n=1 Tax=Candidatus Jorgensenbacteria bacterium RIFCSPHIGHO2_02_FULL_45_20 TaxID=1798470 RepID=A0A1F6BPA9_9BACT|nr:MAG: cell filamentation protein Fic [Candidatus Jorgensenbacteria bacterium RIFCSPHIGHO2_02_FULL_45_20]